MKNKKPSRLDKTLEFLAGRGFYMILAVCVMAIAVSGYVLLFGNGSPTDVKNPPAAQLSTAPSQNIPPSLPPLMQEPDDGGAVDVIGPGDIEISPPPIPDTDYGVPPKTPKPSPAKTPEPTPAQSKRAAPVDGAVIEAFSADELVYDKTMGDWRVHSGADYAGGIGTTVSAITDGKVLDIYDDPLLGICVKISDDDGTASIYANLQEGTNVIKDQLVKTGDSIGCIGNTAAAESAEDSHLHLEVFKDGVNIDPAAYIAGN